MNDSPQLNIRVSVQGTSVLLNPADIIKQDRTPNSYEKYCVTRNIIGKRLDSIADTLLYLNSVTEFSQLPASISIDLDDPVLTQIDIAGIATTIKITNQLNALRFNLPRSTSISILAGHSMSLLEADTLLTSGVDVILPKTSVYGIDAAMEFTEKRKHGDLYPSYLINKSNRVATIKTRIMSIHLTPQQHKIAHSIASKGITNKQIAAQFGISESTVKLHVGLILNKYGIKNRTQIAVALLTQ